VRLRGAEPEQTQNVFGDGVGGACIVAIRVPARVERLGHLVLQSTKYVDALNWYLDNLGARNEFDIRRLVGLLKVPTS